MMEGRRFVVILLDERRIELIVQPRLLAGDLLDLAASHAGVREKDYFSLVFIDETNNFLWLQLDRKVLEHEFLKTANSPSVTVHFMIKFFVDSISQIRDTETVELFYLQARNAIIKENIEIDHEVIFRLAAFALQATYGDYSDDDTARHHLKRLPVLPPSAFKELPSLDLCEDRVIEFYKKLKGHNRGLAIVSYLTLVEIQPTYGVHYYKVVDKSGLPCYLGISHRGIAQYDHSDRRTPRLVFQWKQLENLYFRDRKFSVEVHDPKRVVHALSSFNLYEDAIENSAVHKNDDLLHAICDVTTQVSVSRRTFGPGQVNVNIWYGESQTITKAIWSMAIAQHQFYLDKRRQKFCHKLSSRDLREVANDLSFNKSNPSLSTSSSTSNLSSTDSPGLLHASQVEISEAEKAAKMEILSALNARKEALENKLKEKNSELKLLCIKEGELTGILPPETPLSPGEPVPNLKKRVGTAFTLPDSILKKIKCREEEEVASLELDYEIQKRILSASLKLLKDAPPSKSLKKTRKQNYLLCAEKLRLIEEKLKNAKSIFNGSDLPESAVNKQRKKPRLGHPDDFESSEGCNVEEKTSDGKIPNGDVSCLIDCEEMKAPEIRKSVSMSVPSSPSKPHSRNRLAPESLVDVPHLQRCLSGGYITSSMARRSSYRCKQYPMLSKGVPNQRGGSYYSRYESSVNPVDVNAALYNIPHQRTSLAYQSLDDLDSGEGHHSSVRFSSLDRRKEMGITMKPDSNSVDALDGLSDTGVIEGPQLSPLEASETRHSDGGYRPNVGIHSKQDINYPHCDTPVRSRAISGDYPVPYSRRVSGNQIRTPHDPGSRVPVMETHFYTCNSDKVQSLASHMALLQLKKGNLSCDTSSLVSKERIWKETSLDSVDAPLKSQTITSDQCPVSMNVKMLDHNLSPLECSEKRRPAHEFNLNPLKIDLNESCSSDPLDVGGCEIPCESPKNQTVVSAGKWQPYREISKPFEMSDFYKYSTKFRRTQSVDSNRSYSDESRTSQFNDSSNAQETNPRINSFNSSVRTPDPTNNHPPSQQHGIYQPPSPLSCEPLHHLATDLTPRLSRANSYNGSHKGNSSNDSSKWYDEREPINTRSATLV